MLGLHDRGRLVGLEWLGTTVFRSIWRARSSSEATAGAGRRRCEFEGQPRLDGSQLVNSVWPGSGSKAAQVESTSSVQKMMGSKKMSQEFLGDLDFSKVFKETLQ